MRVILVGNLGVVFGGIGVGGLEVISVETGHKYATAQEAMKEYDDDMVRRGHIITTTNDEVEKIELLI